MDGVHMHRVVIIPGDGIGPEITTATRRVVDVTGVAIDWLEKPAGEDAFANFQNPLPKDTIAAIKDAGVALKGPLTTHVGRGYRSVNVLIRKTFGLYANVRPVKSLPNVVGALANDPKIDLVVVRENTEGLYIGRERREGDTAIAEKVTTKRASRRIAIFAFEYARRYGYQKVTTLHKGNILKLTDGLFLEQAQRTAERYTDIEHQDMIADIGMASIAVWPTDYDVILTQNLNGDYLSDITALIAWLSVGLGPSGQYGKHVAIFEAIHGTAPSIAGKGVANPTGLLRSAVLLLRHLNEDDAANRMDRAIERVYEKGSVRTGELGGSATTIEFADAVIAEMK